MSLSDVIFIAFYTILFISTGGLCRKDVQKRAVKDSFVDDHSGQKIWERNRTMLLGQNLSQLKEGWTVVENWPKDPFKLGQISGVSSDAEGLVYVFHRGDRVWGGDTFDLHNVITDNERRRGPIAIPTVIVYHPETGSIVQKWGEHMFYMPHGITVDREGNIWTTDVALHQIFKYGPLRSNPGTALISLGEAFVPGNDAAHFCKPTSIAITPWNDFFVADGYCNSRILKFDKNGVKISEWGRSTTYHGIGQPANYLFNVVHALTLAEDKGLVCAADRENGRVQCFNWRNDTLAFTLHSPNIGTRLFSLAYAPVNEGLLFVINGPEEKQFPVPISGTVFSLQSRKDLFKFGVNKLKNPHDIAVSPDGKSIFVVEINPFKLWKFQSNDVINSYLINSSNSSVSSVLPSESVSQVQMPSQQSSLTSPSGILPAVLVTSAALIFAGALLSAALVYSRAKRRGCRQCGGQSWMLSRNPVEGFKLGHFLGQHQGFQKVNTGEESEDEEEVVPFA